MTAPARFSAMTDTCMEDRTSLHARRAGRDTAAADEKLRTFAVQAAQLCADLHCEDVQILDVRGKSQLTDFIVIASGTSDRQMRSVAGDLGDLGREYDLKRYGSESDEARTWIVVDFVEVMVHLFEPATRAHYDLEMMWGDAPQIDWQR